MSISAALKRSAQAIGRWLQGGRRKPLHERLADIVEEDERRKGNPNVRIKTRDRELEGRKRP